MHHLALRIPFAALIFLVPNMVMASGLTPHFDLTGN